MIEKRTDHVHVPGRHGRMSRIDWLAECNTWRVWLHTKDFIFGNYLLLRPDGEVLNVWSREDKGDDTFIVRPADTR